MSQFDQKTSRAATSAVIAHAMKSLRQSDGKDAGSLADELDKCVSMLRMFSCFKKPSTKKKGKKAKKGEEQPVNASPVSQGAQDEPASA